MIDSTPLTVIDERPAGTTELVVEADTGRQAQKALQNPLREASHTTGAMAFQGEDVLEGPEDGLDPLAKGGEMRPLSWLVFSLWTDVACLKTPDRPGELFTRVALVGKKDLPAFSPAARQEFEPHLPFIALGRGERERPGSAVGGEDGMQPDSPEVAGVAGAVPVVADVGKGRAKSRLPASRALNRRRVDEQEIVGETGALLGKDEKEPVKDGTETAPALEVGGLRGKFGEEMAKAAAGRSQKAAVGGNTHDGLSHAQGDDLGIRGLATGISSRLWQKVIGCAINDSAEGVEVGVVHRGLQADGDGITVGFGLSASKPFLGAILVESII